MKNKINLFTNTAIIMAFILGLSLLQPASAKAIIDATSTFGSNSSTDLAQDNSIPIPTTHIITPIYGSTALYGSTETESGSCYSVNVSQEFVLNDGCTITFDFVPKDGYHVANVVVDGTSVGALTTHYYLGALKTYYAFTNVTIDHTISAIFEEDSAGSGTSSPFGAESPTDHTITASVGPNGSFSMPNAHNGGGVLWTLSG